MFQKFYANIGKDLEQRCTDTDKSNECAGRNAAVENYTFFRESRSPAESPLKVR